MAPNHKTALTKIGAVLLGVIALSWIGGFAWHYLHFGDEAARAVVPGFITEVEPIPPIPFVLNFNPRKVALGERLFHEPKLSRDNTIACVSCHNLALGGTDRLPVSLGVGGAKGTINAPTVFNSGFNFRQFWDGRAASLEEQINGPTHAANEMASDWPQILAKLQADPAYPPLFAAIYPDGVTAANIRDAIATFERSLYTPNSRFDRYLRGEADALTEAERRGYERFKNYGCVSCHQGVNLGGNMYQTFGVMGDYFADRGNPTEADFGRFNVTGEEKDRFVFKVPTLRNIALTAPYFHDGSAKTLEDAVTIMGRYQLGRPLTEEDIDLLVAFLRTLTGEYRGTPL